MEGFLSLLFLGAIIGIIIYFKNKNKQQEEQETKEAEEIRIKEEELLKEKWEEKKKELETNGLPIITDETLQLTKNEVCHFAGDAYYCKIKNQTVGYEGGSRGTSFRLMKGVSFRIGNHRGHYIKEEFVEKTNGIIYLTNKKIVFTGLKNSSVIRYTHIINLGVAENMLQIQTEKKTYLFEIVDSFNFMLILEHIINKIEEDE